MTELLGGERVTIVAGNTVVQTFERTMSDALQRHVVDQATEVIDLWRLVTPMSAKQKRKLPPLPDLDVQSLPLEACTGSVPAPVEATDTPRNCGNCRRALK